MQKIIGKLRFKLRNAPSTIHGQGVFSSEAIPKRTKIGELSGVLISKREARKKVKEQHAIHMVELWNGKALDCSEFRNELAFINHSCQPNCYMRNINNLVEFYSLSVIKANEELTCNYGETHHGGQLRCNCGRDGCIGNL